MQDSSTSCADTSLRRLSPRMACIASLLAITLLLPAHAFGGTSRYDAVVSRMKAVGKSPFAQILQIGKSAGGRPIYAVLIADSKPACCPAHTLEGEAPSEPGVGAAQTELRPPGCERGDTRVLVISGQHGDEVSPVYAMLDLAEDLARDPALLRGTALVIVPVANPDGFTADRRFNARGADLNRSWRSSSAPETRAVQKLVNRFKPQVVMDLHEWMDRDPVHTNCIEVAGFGAEPQLKLGRLLSAFSRHEMARRGGNPNSIRTVFYRSEADNRLAHRHFSDMGICGLLFETASGQPRVARMRIYREFVTTAVLTLTRLPDQRVTTQLAAVSRNLGEGQSPFPEEPKPQPARSAGVGDIACWIVIVTSTAYIMVRSLGSKNKRTSDVPVYGRPAYRIPLTDVVCANLPLHARVALIQQQRVRPSDRGKRVGARVA